MKTFLKQHMYHIIGLIILLIVHIKFTFNMQEISDIVLADESGIIQRAVNFSIGNMRGDGWLYVLWYKFLNLFSENLLNLYFLNNIVLIGLNSYLIYLIMMKSKVNWFFALTGATVFLISTINADIWPFVTRLALFFLLLTFYFSMFFQKGYVILLVWAIGAFFTMYIRPEFTMVFWVLLVSNAIIHLLIVLRTYKTVKSFKLNKQHVILVSLILGFLIFGSPMKGSRSIVAFGQHFSMNYTAWSGEDINPWTNWEKIMENQLQTTTSISQAVKNNPKIIMKHIGMNLHNLSANLLLHLRPSGMNSEYGKKVYKAFARLAVMLIIILVFKHFYWIYKQRKITMNNTVNKLILFVLIFTPPVGVSTILIYPRLHYVIMLIGLLFLLSWLLLSQILPKIQYDEKYKPLVSVLLVIMLIYCVPFKVTGEPGFSIKKTNNSQFTQPRNVSIIQSINKLNLPTNTVLLSMRMNLDLFLEPEIKHLFAGEKELPFNDYMRENNINAILVTEDLIDDIRFREDDDFQSFMKNTNEFQKITIADSHVYLLFKEQ